MSYHGPEGAVRRDVDAQLRGDVALSVAAIDLSICLSV